MLKLKNGREVLFSGRVDNADVPWITNRIKSVVEVCHSIHSMPSFDKSHSLKSSCWSCSLLSLLACDVWRERKGSGPSRRYMRLQQVTSALPSLCKTSCAAKKPLQPAEKKGVLKL